MTEEVSMKRLLVISLVAAFVLAATVQAQWVKAYSNGPGTEWVKAY